MTDVPFRATVPGMTPYQRISRSKQVISGWEALGGPGGRIADTMRMIREEVVALARIGEAEPHLRAEANDLVRRYQLMAVRMKLVH